MRKLWSVGLGFLGCFMVAGNARAQGNLIVQGGFEVFAGSTASYPWLFDSSGCTAIWSHTNCRWDFTTVDNTVPDPINGPVHSGLRSFEVQALGAPIAITQTVQPIQNHVYDFSGYINGGRSVFFDAGLSNCTPTGTPDPAPVSGWGYFTESCTAFTSAPVTVKLGVNGPPNQWDGAFFDDISLIDTGVTVTPEPGSIALLATGLLTLIPMMRRRTT